MSLIGAIYNRRIGLLVSRFKDITKNINLVRSYDNNICIKNINRLNKYIQFSDNNYEIYALNNNKLVDYYVSNEINIDQKYIEYINKILSYTNLTECEVYIFNTNYRNTGMINITRSETKKREMMTKKLY